MIQTVKFTRPPWRDSLGRNGFIKTTGIEIFDQDCPADQRDVDDVILLAPVSTRGNTSPACRVAIARSAVPNLIDTLQRIAGWFPLTAISIDGVYEAAVEPEYGAWKDFPEAYDIAAEAAEYVAANWEDGDNGSTDWALQKFEEFAIERGITLQPPDRDGEDNPIDEEEE